MISRNGFIKRILLLLTAVCLSHCTKMTESHLRIHHQLASPYTMPASAYLALANNQAGEEKQSLQLMAAGRYIDEGQWQEGQKILATLSVHSPSLMNQKNLLLGKVDLMRHQWKAAIEKLAMIQHIDTMPLYYQVQYHEMLATAYRAAGNIMEAVNERSKLENLLPDEMSRSNNRRALWLMLASLPSDELNSIAVEASSDSDRDGWIQLAVISRSSPEQVEKTLSHLQEWKTKYPHHPGNAILPASMAQIRPYLFAMPRHIALLLPLSGKLSGPGNAIRDGFMQAYESSGNTSEIEVLSYDTDKASASHLYQKAIAAGADYVVGPLSKTDVAQVASMNHPVPTLLLNDIAQGIKPNAYQFGLSPVSEAKQVAARARKDGHTRALMIIPANSWGGEVSQAFIRQWKSNGGQVVDILRYGDNENVAPAVKQFLQAKDLTSEHSALASRRRDFDMIFLLAYPSKARQIMPMLRYYFAGDVPVYATSAVYSGHADSLKDRDLDNIIFCDMPWVFTHQMGSKNWPEQWNSYNRLYALGRDSFTLLTQLNQLILFPAMGVNDSSGILYMGSHQQIARILTWGQFHQGLAQML